jgi:uncharacterized FAD-dependent dehydrogenase
MIKLDTNFELELIFDLDDPDDQQALKARVAAKLGVAPEELPALEIKKRAVDARRNRVRFCMTIGLEEPNTMLGGLKPQDVKGEAVIIVGAGPAGLFCAYELARHGIKSKIIDRGKKVQERRRDLKGLNQHGVIDPDSNYCFGEGGAGTYSDGKLYTRSHKRGDVRDILEILALHGAPTDILRDARPHVGSNRLPKVITAMREHLEKRGVEFIFEARVTNILLEANKAFGVKLADNKEICGQAVVIATGHSARDIYELAEQIGIDLAPKPFAVGVRIEHPQPLINAIQYGSFAAHPKLRAAAYALAYTPQDGRGAFSFCMCPGGFIVPASTNYGELVVNGMSLSRRDSPFANSGLVVAVRVEDLQKLKLSGPLAGLEIQKRIEQAAWNAGAGALCAPAQRATDFVARKLSTDLPQSSYQPGLRSADVFQILDSSGLPLASRLSDALKAFDKKMPGYLTSEAVLVGVESRSSSPVRMLRDAESLQSNIARLYPCGEGAGYAGGIVSAAMDGIRVARALMPKK